jgi:hypothetical protein
MFCSKCGNQVADGAAFCDKCGAQLNAQPPQAPQQPQYDPNQFAQAPEQPYGFAPQAPALTMKWYKFLIYFLLFAVAVLNVIGGINALTGANYTVSGENVSKLVYALYPSLKTVDIIYGIACILLGIYQVSIRFQLAKYKTNAPKALFGMYVANAIIVAIYSFSVLGIVPTEVVSHSELTGQAIGAIIGAGVMIWLNKIYFDKRKHLFVNQ